MNLDFFKKESPLQGMMGRGGGVVARIFSGPPSGGFTVLVTPSINGQSLFNLDQEELILDGSNATDYTITVDSSSTEENGTIQVDAWGQATSDSNGGYAGGFLSMTPSTTYAAKLNAGGGTGGSSRGNGISPNGGGYAGLFNNSVSHGNSRVIAGGGGGTGSGTGGSDGRSYGFGYGGFWCVFLGLVVYFVRVCMGGNSCVNFLGLVCWSADTLIFSPFLALCPLNEALKDYF